MKCPKDGHDLVSSQYHGVQIESCPHCGGMWLDAGEIDVVAHEERPALFTRVLADAFATFRARRPGRHRDRIRGRGSDGGVSFRGRVR